MDFYRIVRPEHLNHFHYLFGGVMLQWVDEYVYVSAVHDYPHAHLVTRGMDRVAFTRGVNNGAMLKFKVVRDRVGRTSVSYKVEVFARDLQQDEEYPVFDTEVTMVAVDENGAKTPLESIK